MIQLLADHGAILDVKDSQNRTPMTFAEGVFLALQPPSRKPTTIALLEKLMGSKKSVLRAERSSDQPAAPIPGGRGIISSNAADYG
jgi:hypothetical protein